ncbi:MAG: sugar transferase [Candidatus Zhuqueibacterota bacterium]
MPKTIEKILLILVDYLAIHVTFFFWGLLRQKLGYYTEDGIFYNFFLSNLIFLFWFFLFFFYGLYKSWYAHSRFDEFIAVLKTVSIGVFLIFLLTSDYRIDLNSTPPFSRVMIISYWFMLVFVVSLGRIIIRTIQRKLLQIGIGRRNTVIIGWSDKSRAVYDQLKKSPALGYEVVGFVSLSKDRINEQHDGTRVIGSVKEIARLVDQYKVEEIVIAPKEVAPKQVLSIISRCDSLPVQLKIVPDIYDIVMGYGRTNQLYGVPLMEILPQLMPPWEKRVKRTMDIGISLFVLIVFSPIWILVALAIKLESSGPVLFKQKRVGMNGRIFTIFKFRSMVHRAEKETGPIWADETDPRVTVVGKIMRKMRIDEIPQFFNILFNDMSLIGPRPERPFFVDKLKREIPLYSRRLRMKPGITGWAQIKAGYDTSVDNVRKKLEFDLFYLENMSLRMDLKILLNTLYVMIAGKGQ